MGLGHELLGVLDWVQSARTKYSRPRLASSAPMKSPHIAAAVQFSTWSVQTLHSISTQIIKAPKGANIITIGDGGIDSDGRQAIFVCEWNGESSHELLIILVQVFLK